MKYAIVERHRILYIRSFLMGKTQIAINYYFPYNMFLPDNCQ